LRCRKLENWMSPVSRPFFLLKSAFRMWIIKQYQVAMNLWTFSVPRIMYIDNQEL
jgi:hypothetical protein